MPAPGWRRDVAWVMAQVNYTKHSIIPPRVRTRIHACLHVHVHLYASTFGVRDKGRFEPGGCCKHEIGWEEWSRLFEKKKSSRFISCWLFFLSFFLFFVLNGRMKQMLPFMEIGLATWKRRWNRIMIYRCRNARRSVITTRNKLEEHVWNMRKGIKKRKKKRLLLRNYFT